MRTPSGQAQCLACGRRRAAQPARGWRDIQVPHSRQFIETCLVDSLASTYSM
ncbi:hypothetical protein [Cupriavidus basilensis]|uniref:hypothetical protein n=1 Tax=Cupriavidus basilensis TaxID=68895 RepID=UPI000A72854B|nr:hypothetical protein [Cupriavidus basilensis]